MDDVSLYPRENEGGPKVSTELTYLRLKPATNLKLGKGVFYWRTIASIGIAPFILSNHSFPLLILRSSQAQELLYRML